MNSSFTSRPHSTILFVTMRTLFLCLLSLSTLTGYAQSNTPVTVPIGAVGQLENVKELTKSVAVNKPTKAKLQAEARPDINRMLVLAADDFVRVTKDKPTKEAYLLCLDQGLARLAPLTTDDNDRKEVAEYYQELLEIVGVASSEGRLMAFATSSAPKK